LTLTFLRLGKIGPVDAVMYVLAQFAGGCLGVLLSAQLLGNVLADASVNFVVTLPGARGAGVAFCAELAISMLMMSMVLVTSNHPRWKRYTGVCAGILVALYITFEAPLSGMSMNPARSFGSALWARDFEAFWVYLCAPPLGMLLAAELYLRLSRRQHQGCAKLHHAHGWHCIFCRVQSGSPAASVRRLEPQG
jgi:aquaporin Z